MSHARDMGGGLPGRVAAVLAPVPSGRSARLALPAKGPSKPGSTRPEGEAYTERLPASLALLLAWIHRSACMTTR
jgi:hypothetical protein